MPVLSVTNQKGGVGKTTTAIHLAAGLLKLEPDSTALIIDLDSQMNASKVLAKSRSWEDSDSTLDLLTGNVLHSHHILDATSERLKIVPGCTRLVEIDAMLSGKLDGFFRLRESLQKAVKEFSYIILDCPPSLSMATINALVAADFLLIPLMVSKFSLDGLQIILDTISTIQSRYNPGLMLAGSVFTLHNPRTTLSKAMREQIAAHVKVYDTFIPHSVSVEEAHLVRKTVYEYAPRSPVALAYINLCREVLSDLG